MKLYITLLGAALLAFPMGSAKAADLGGNCCADLEERVAELEATTARKAVRTLSMTISGQVNAAVVYYDFNVDDFNSNDTFVSMGQGAGSRIQIDGRANINKDWEAGYRISFTFDGVSGSNYGLDIFGPDFARPTSDSVGSREAYVFIRSAQIGAVSVGTRGSVLESAGKVDITGKLGTQGNLDPGSQLGEALGILAQQGDGDGGISQRAGVRYDSPSFAGFILSADWTNDGNVYDNWAVRLSYANQFGDFRVAAAAAYGADMFIADNWSGGLIAGPAPEASRMVASGGIQHVPSGIFVNASWGETDLDVVGDQNSSHWAVQAGIQASLFSVGKTTVYGAYYHSEDNSILIPNPGALDFDIYVGAEYELNYWGLGLVQSIDAAGMDIYAGYRSYDSDDCENQLDVSCDLDVFMAGAIVKF